MSSDYNTYGSLKCKEALLDVSGITLHDPNNDTKKLVISASGLGAGTATLSLPTVTGALLSNQSTLSGAKLSAGSVADAALASGISATKVDINGATAEASAADADEFLIYDASATSNKKMTLANLKTYAGGTPVGTSGQAIIYNGSNVATAVTLSGDMTVNNAGVTAVGANKITSAMIQNNAVTGVKCAAGFIDNINKFQAGVVNTAALGNAQVTKAKLQDAPTTYGTQQASKLVALDASKDSAGVRNWVCEGDVEAGASSAIRLGP